MEIKSSAKKTRDPKMMLQMITDLFPFPAINPGGSYWTRKVFISCHQDEILW